jgi:type II secretory pathway pseudopilin PulG
MNAMRKQLGFTVIELIITILLLVIVGTLFLTLKRETDAVGRDTQRKTAINAMYYNLEEAYFATNKSYPLELNATTLKAMDPSLFKDPNGNVVGTQESDYRYEPTGCNDTICTGYMLRTKLEKENDFVKRNR